MGAKNLFATIFVFVYVLTGIKGEDCETYDGNGICIPPCPEDSKLVSSDCKNPIMSQRTCNEPRSYSLGIICDYTKCDCIKPKVYDETANKCVRLSECSGHSKKYTPTKH